MMRVNLFTINSKKILAVAALCAITLSGCGQADQVKTINKEAQAAASTETAAAQEGNVEAQSSENAAGSSDAASDGYYFESDGVTLTTDIEMAPVLEKLGDSNTYFEAASCAFNGLDKFYTYDHFEIDTYPDGDKDYISAIVLLDDIVSTPEGIAVGAGVDEVIATYGEGFDRNGSSYIYTKGTTHLTFVCNGDTVTNISYDSTKLDDQQ
jgi:hypothetical protein